MDYLLSFIFFPIDHRSGNKVVNLHPWWRGVGGCSDLWSSSPPVKTWFFWPELSYRLSAQPLIPSNGTRGSRNFTILFCLHLLCTRLYFLVCDRLHIGYTTLFSLCLLPLFPLVSLCICPCLFNCSHVLPSTQHPLFRSLSLSYFYCCSLLSLSPLVHVLSPSPHVSPCPHLCRLSFCVCPSLFSNFTPSFFARCVNPLLSTPSNNSLHPVLLFCHYGYLF